MWHIVSIRLDRIGTPAARFLDELIECADEFDRPMDTIVWLRNGGGKSCVLSLLCAHLRPHRDHFLATAATGKHLEDYVQSGDTSHTIIEWANERGQRLLTGAVYEWDGLQAPEDPAKNHDRLTSVWYTVTPAEGTHGEDLPRAGADGVPLRLKEYKMALRELPAERELVIADGQKRWAKTLNDRGMDPDLLTPILAMNVTEGGIDAAFAYANPDAFIRYLLSLVADPKSAAGVGVVLEQVRGQLADRPRTQADLAFASESEPLLRDLGARYDKHQGAHDDLSAARSGATQLAGSFGTRLAATNELLSHQQDAIADATNRHQLARTARDTATFTAAELRRIAAVLRSAAAETWRAGSERALGASRRRVAALAGVEPLYSQQEQGHLVEELVAQLAQQEKGAAPLAGRRDSAAAVLHLVLTQDLAALTAADGLRAAATLVAEAARVAGRKSAAAATGELSALATTGKQLRKVITAADAALAAARADKVLTEDEDPAAAALRLSAADKADAESVAAIDQVRGQIETDLGTCRAALKPARAACTKASAARTAAQDEHDALVGAVAALSANPAVADLAQADHVDVLAECRDLARAATGQVERHDLARMQHAVDTAQARRALAELQTCQLLPPEVDLERALSALAAADIDATSGWRYLADNVPVASHGAVLAAAPSLVAGVAVHDPAKLAAARQVLTSYQLRPITAIGVGTTADLHAAVAAADAGTASTTWVLAAAPALTDRAQAQAEVELRDLEVAEADGRDSDLCAQREDAAALGSALSALAERYPPGAAARLLDQLEHSVQLDQDATAALAALERDENSLQDQDRDAELERRRLQECRRHTSADLAVLVALVAAAGPTQVARTELAGLPGLEAAQRELHTAGERAESEANTALRGFARAGDDAVAARRPMTSQLDQLPASARAAATPGQRSSVPLASARAGYEQAAAAYDKATSGSELAGELAGARKVMGSYTRAVSLLTEAVRVGAGEMLDGGVDPQQLPALTRDAAATESAAAADLVDAQTEVRLAAEDVRTSSRVGRGRLRVLEGPEPTTAAAALAAALVQDGLREQSLLAENAATAELDVLDKAGDGYRQLVSHLTTMLTSLPAPEPALGPWAAFTGDVEAARALVSDAISAVAGATEVEVEARRVFDAQAQKLFLWANGTRFATVTEQMRSRFAGEDLGANLAPESAWLAGEMGEAAASLRAHLAELDEHQRTAVVAMRGMVRGALKTLNRLQNASALPDTLPAWAGQRFLTVGPKRQVEHTDAVMDDRIGRVVDALCTAGSEIPKGPDLLWAATNAVVGEGNWTAKVLKPTVDAKIELSTVAQMLKWSGGEKVTANLLLFALAARVRAIERGKDHVGFGVLPLDNPLGKASYVPFLELQRKVAGAYGIQLLFLTGVADLRAVGRFPNIVRMANRSAGGRRYVGVVGREVEQGATGQLSHARILRPDPIPGL